MIFKNCIHTSVSETGYLFTEIQKWIICNLSSWSHCLSAFSVTDAIMEFSGGVLTVTGPNETASIFATYPSEYVSLTSSFLDQVSDSHPEPVHICLVKHLLISAASRNWPYSMLPMFPFTLTPKRMLLYNWSKEIAAYCHRLIQSEKVKMLCFT